MTPRQLTQFLAVCHHGTMSGAAIALNIAQPALSKQISQLEHELRTQLFLRHSRGVTLTEAGILLREEAAELVRRIDSLKFAIKRGDDDVSGDVTLVVIGSLAPTVAAELYQRIEMDYSKITLRIVDYPSDRACAALIQQEADLAIVPNAAVDLPQAESIPLFREKFSLISRAVPNSEQTPISITAIGDTPLVSTFHGHDLRRRIEEAARSKGVQLNVKYETGSINVVGKLVEEGLACSIVPTTFWLGQIAAGRIIVRPIVKPIISRVHSLCWLSGIELSPAMIAVRELILIEVQAMIASGKLSATPA